MSGTDNVVMFPTGESVETDKAAILKSLRDWVDWLETGDIDPARVAFVVESRTGKVYPPFVVGIRTTSVHAVGMLGMSAHIECGRVPG